MQENITQELYSTYLHPRKETLFLLMQYARALYVEKRLPDGLSTMILN